MELGAHGALGTHAEFLVEGDIRSRRDFATIRLQPVMAHTATESDLKFKLATQICVR